MMKHFKIYEEKESLESMILGINQDPKRKMFDEMLKGLCDINVERIVVEQGMTPRFEVDGKHYNFGHYPSASELTEILELDENHFESLTYESSLLQAANTTRLGACCGVGEDIYLDPNED